MRNIILILLCMMNVSGLAKAAAEPDFALTGNLYMVSRVPPEIAEQIGFPVSALSDNIQRFFQGVAPHVDSWGRPAFYHAFRYYQRAIAIAAAHAQVMNPVYIYSINSAEWYGPLGIIDQYTRSRSPALTIITDEARSRVNTFLFRSPSSMIVPTLQECFVPA